MLNINKSGFTLLEVLAVFFIIGLVLIPVISIMGNTFSATSKTSYELLKKNIIESSNTFIHECRSGIVDCGLEDNNTFNNRNKDISLFNYYKEGKKLKNLV